MNLDMVTDEEQKTDWDEVPGLYRFLIFKNFAHLYKSDPETVERVFELAKPKVVVTKKYWRVDVEDGKLLNRLLETYC